MTKGKGKRPKEKRPHGRPTIYTHAIAERVCAQIATGRTLRDVCRDEGMPHEATVRSWVIDDREGFCTQYARARVMQHDVWAEEIMTISDDGHKDAAVPQAVNRDRLRADSRKWLLSKLRPEQYGDRLEVKSTNVNVNLSDEQLLNEIRTLEGSLEIPRLAEGDGAPEGSTTH